MAVTKWHAALAEDEGVHRKSQRRLGAFGRWRQGSEWVEAVEQREAAVAVPAEAAIPLCCTLKRETCRWREWRVEDCATWVEAWAAHSGGVDEDQPPHDNGHEHTQPAELPCEWARSEVVE